jgi:hypothetical protein
MALSPKMLALIQKIEAVDAAHFAGLRESGKQDKQAKADEKTRAAARSAGAKKAVAAREAKRNKK